MQQFLDAVIEKNSFSKQNIYQSKMHDKEIRRRKRQLTLMSVHTPEHCTLNRKKFRYTDQFDGLNNLKLTNDCKTLAIYNFFNHALVPLAFRLIEQ